MTPTSGWRSALRERPWCLVALGTLVYKACDLGVLFLGVPRIREQGQAQIQNALEVPPAPTSAHGSEDPKQKDITASSYSCENSN